jgi:hypothetical protein
MLKSEKWFHKHESLVTFRNNTVFRLLVVKLLTYPIIGFSTLVAFRVVRVRFTLEEFNLFVLMWSSIGIIGIAEYGLGVSLTNHLLIKGFDKEFKRKTKIFSCILFTPLIISFLVGLNSQLLYKAEAIIGVNELAGIPLNQILINVSSSVFFITCYNLVARVSNGVSLFSSPQITLAVGNVFALIILVYLPNALTGITQYLVILASAYLFSAAFQLCNKRLWKELNKGLPQSNQLEIFKKLSGGGYSWIILSISLIVTYINFFPRWKFSSIAPEIETSGYLTIMVVVGVFSSLSSALGPVFWNVGVNRKLDGVTQFPYRSYRIISMVNLALLAPFFLLLLVLSIFYRIEMNSWQFYSSGFLAYLFLSFQNLHIIASNYLVERQELIIQLCLLVLQAFFLTMLIVVLDVRSSTILYLIQTGIILLISVLPSIVILRSKTSHVE